MSFKQLTLEQIEARIRMFELASELIQLNAGKLRIEGEQSEIVAKEIELLKKRFEKAQAIKLRKAAGTPPKYRIPSLNK